MALEAAHSARVTLESILDRLIAAEQRNASVGSGPQYRLARLAAHISGILDDLANSIDVPDIFDYERTFLQSPDYQPGVSMLARRDKEKEWMARHRRETLDPRPWTIPQSQSLLAFVHSQAASAADRKKERLLTSTPWEDSEDALADEWADYKDELREQLYLEGRFDEIDEFDEWNPDPRQST